MTSHRREIWLLPGPPGFSLICVSSWPIQRGAFLCKEQRRVCFTFKIDVRQISPLVVVILKICRFWVIDEVRASWVDRHCNKVRMETKRAGKTHQLVFSIFHSVCTLALRKHYRQVIGLAHYPCELWLQFCQDCTCFSQDAWLNASI